MPLAVGLGLGILHAQITAYDPQRRTRTSSSRRTPGSAFSDSIVGPESLPPPLPPHPQSSIAVETQSNLSNHASATTQPCLPAETTESNPATKDNANLLSSPCHIPNKGNQLDNSLEILSHQLVETEGDEVLRLKAEKSPNYLTEGSGAGDGVPADPIPIGHRRRALSLKTVSHTRGKVFGNGGGGSQREAPLERKSSSGAGNDADVESDQEAYDGKLRYCLRKRSASLSPDFCLSVSTTPPSVSPLEQKIKHFKEAKMRGITDPEVFAGYQLKQLSGPVLVGQQLSPPSKSVSKWKTC
ncbi:unnamed protein product, partial [Hydatigera taeniaeformis]|uniref:SH2 domain-containing protein n=1 Tax=Hydatigena taeniaeformis TaxID=6205 RepID=A0A0R3WW08_HYDTA